MYPQYIAKIGVVQDFTTNGDVVVEYRGTRWPYNPAALTKVMLTQSFVTQRASYFKLVNYIWAMREPKFFFKIVVNIGIRFNR